jgi:hypothetical protein
MNNPYDLHSWSKLYQEEAHQAAQRRHLAHRLRADRRPPSEQQRQGRWSLALGKLADAVRPS